MTSPIEKLTNALRANAPDPDHTIEQLRIALDTNSAGMPVPGEVSIEERTVAGRPAEVITPPGDTGGRTILYLHGGGYCMGSLLSNRALGANIALATGATVVDLDYRLAPEHPCPAGIDDAVAAYDELLADGVAPERIAVGGDSAGGGLTVATLLALRDGGRPLPVGGVGISPWLDLQLPGGSMDTNAATDPMVSRALLTKMAAWYAGELPHDDPRCSPVNADLTGLPPLLLHVGDAETLRDDVVRFGELAGAAGVDTTVEVWPEMIHVWHMFAPRLEPANEALRAIGDWLGKRWR